MARKLHRVCHYWGEFYPPAEGAVVLEFWNESCGFKHNQLWECVCVCVCVLPEILMQTIDIILATLTGKNGGYPLECGLGILN